MIAPLKDADGAVRDNLKRMMVKVAKDKGFTIPKGGSKFEAAAQPAA
jgi:hypothetical protein